MKNNEVFLPKHGIVLNLDVISKNLKSHDLQSGTLFDRTGMGNANADEVLKDIGDVLSKRFADFDFRVGKQSIIWSRK